MSISAELRQRVRAAAGDRCGYCLSHQRYVMGTLEIEHLLAKARGGSDEEENLWLCCSLCNGFKGAQVDAKDPLTGRLVMLFNPRRQPWSDHFTWTEGGILVRGITPCGRATVDALQLNNYWAVQVRRAWVGVGWHPPK